MNLAVETVSVLAWWTSFHSMQSVFPQDIFFTVASGGISGLVIAGITQTFPKARQFPETAFERRLIPSNRAAQNSIKLGASHAVFFTVYSGLRNGIYKARAANDRPEGRDWKDCMNDFLSGGVGGLCYRAASQAYYRGPVDNPMMTMQHAPKMLAGTFLLMGAACTVFESIDHQIRTEFK